MCAMGGLTEHDDLPVADVGDEGVEVDCGFQCMHEEGCKKSMPGAGDSGGGWRDWAVGGGLG